MGGATRGEVKEEAALFLCSVSDDPKKKYRKVGDGLVVNSLRRSDAGEYTCRAYQVSPHISNIKSKVIRFNVMREWE